MPSRSIRALLAAGVLVLSLQPALAQSSGPSDYLRTSCSGDFKRLCGKVTPGKGRAAACMKERESELTPECRAAMNSPEGQAQRDRY